MLIHTTKAAVFAAILAAVFSGAIRANADMAKPLAVPAGDLTTALQSISKQSGVELLFNRKQLEGVHTRGVEGTLTAEQAIRKLLEGTNFELSRDEATGAMMIGERATAARLAGEDSAEGMRVSQAGSESKSREAAPVEQGAPMAKLEEVTVTAQKRKELLKDVPISISAVSGKDLDRSSLTSSSDLLNLIPGVATTTGYASGGTLISVRGVTAGATIFAGGNPIAYYVDSVPFGLIESAIVPDQNLYDLQRIEVLRGPQGTLYGASALNGVVRILTNEADLNHFDAKARVSDSATSGGGNNYRGDMAVNIPLIEGKLAVRGVVGYENDDGWIDNPQKSDINDAQRRNYRLKLNAQPIDSLSVGLSAWKSRDGYGAPSTANGQDFTPALQDQSIETGFDAYGLKLGYAASAVSIDNTASYLDYTNDGGLDLDPYLVFLGAPVQATDPYFLSTRFRSHVLSDELVVSSPRGKAWRWSIGGMFRRATEGLRQRFTGLPVPPTDILFVSRSIAAFGEITRVFDEDRLELTVGMRHFKDHVNAEYNLNADDPTSVLDRRVSRFSANSPRAVLTWHASKNSTLYGSYSEGFRSGFPQGANVPPEFPALLGDKLKNYEVGAKGSFLDARINYDSAVYYMDWRDIQQNLSFQYHGVPTAAFVNGTSASGVGVDFGGTAELVHNLTVGLNFGWNNLQMDSTTISGGAVLFAKGDRPNLSPEYTAGALLEYSFPVGGSGFNARFHASGNYISEQVSRTIVAGESVFAKGDPMFTARASAELAAPDHWSLALFMDNATNNGRTPARSVGAPENWNSRIRPRTVGLQLNYQFGD